MLKIVKKTINILERVCYAFIPDDESAIRNVEPYLRAHGIEVKK